MNMKDFWTQVVLERGVDEANRAVAEMKRLFPEKGMVAYEAGVRVGDLEIAPPSLWRIKNWYGGLEYCDSLGDGYRMPTKEELDTMCQDDSFRRLFTELYGTEEHIWSSSEFSASTAWKQRPRDAPQYTVNKGNALWVVPCRRVI